MADNLATVAKGLRELAQGKSDGEKAIRTLADKLRSRDHADLVGVDLAAAYAPERMLPDLWGRTGAVLSLVELLRDALVFVPVAYTWWKIADALRAFSGYRGSDPFLLAWQRGFAPAGAPASQRQVEPLADSAMTVATVIVLVIVLTMVGHVGRGWYERRVEARWRRLGALLANATLLLVGSSPGEDAQATKTELAKIGSQVSTASQKLSGALRKASDDIVSAVNTSPGSQLHAMFTKWTEAAGKLEKLGTRLQSSQQELDRLGSLHKELSTLIEKFGTESTTLLTELRSERQVSRDEAKAHLAMADQVSRATETLGDSLLALNERAEQFKEIVNRLDYMVEQLDEDRYTR